MFGRSMCPTSLHAVAKKHGVLQAFPSTNSMVRIGLGGPDFEAAIYAVERPPGWEFQDGK